MNIPDPNDSWAQVELYRWQHGELPSVYKTCKKLHVPTALKAMADAIEEGCKSGGSLPMPSPYNVCAVLRFAAKILPENAEHMDPPTTKPHRRKRLYDTRRH